MEQEQSHNLELESHVFESKWVLFVEAQYQGNIEEGLRDIILVKQKDHL